MAIGILSVLGLLKKVPKLVKAIKGGNGGLASKAIDKAKAVTGAKDENSAVEDLNSNPELRHDYEIALLENEHIPDRLHLQNTEGARDMYKKFHEKADDLAEHIMTYNLIVAFLLVITNVASVIWLEDKTLIAIISSSTTGLAAQLMAERQNVVNFFFGSSMGSKNKDKK